MQIQVSASTCGSVPDQNNRADRGRSDIRWRVPRDYYYGSPPMLVQFRRIVVLATLSTLFGTISCGTAQHPLVGRWGQAGVETWAFRPDGTGTDSFNYPRPMRWSVSGDVLTMDLSEVRKGGKVLLPADKARATIHFSDDRNTLTIAYAPPGHTFQVTRIP